MIIHDETTGNVFHVAAFEDIPAKYTRTIAMLDAMELKPRDSYVLYAASFSPTEHMAMLPAVGFKIARGYGVVEYIIYAGGIDAAPSQDTPHGVMPTPAPGGVRE